MHLEAAPVIEREVALGTLERLLAGVDALMLRQVGLLFEALVADRTDEGPLVRVHPHVVLERRQGDEVLSKEGGGGVGHSWHDPKHEYLQFHAVTRK